MKKILFLIILLSSCAEYEDPYPTIIIDYDMPYMLLLMIDDSYLYINEYHGHTEINDMFIQDKVRNYSKLDVSVYKIYEPYDGLLVVEVFDKMTVAQEGIRKAELIWQK